MSLVSEVESGAAQLVDVRDAAEWEEQHAQGAIHIVLGALLEGDIGSLDKDKPVYVYCASGDRSSMAEAVLYQHGFAVSNIGGLNDWIAAGGAVE